MPIYEYACTACDHKLEILQKMSDEPLIQCPACHQNTLKKLVSAAGFRLKGTGWYETDFKDKKKTEPEKKTESEKKEESPKVEKTDSATTTPTE
jgi:putative FmdB family regulatory protein